MYICDSLIPYSGMAVNPLLPHHYPIHLSPRCPDKASAEW